ncbi:DNA polymerase III epsilon subunit-like protein [Bradyrhizobium sp. USDA 4501]
MIRKMASMEAGELERMAAILESSGQYRIFRRLEPRSVYHLPDWTMRPHRGIFLELETTGLDSACDETIEIGMVPFDFAPDGRIFSVHETLSRFRDPGRPIPAEVSAITGITDDMVTGNSTDPAELEPFLGEAVVVTAHNAAFDRRFAERLCGTFARLARACSWSEIPWAEEGFVDGAKLGNLASASGFFHDGHRAIDDCRAGLEVLSRVLPRSGRRGLDLLLESARAAPRSNFATSSSGAATAGTPARMAGRELGSSTSVAALTMRNASSFSRISPDGTTSRSMRGASMRSTGTPIVVDPGWVAVVDPIALRGRALSRL